MMLTVKQALDHGYRIVRGSYYRTADDRADRWYVDHEDEPTMDRRGPGYRTQHEALEALERYLDGDEGPCMFCGEPDGAHDPECIGL